VNDFDRRRARQERPERLERTDRERVDDERLGGRRKLDEAERSEVEGCLDIEANECRGAE